MESSMRLSVECFGPVFQALNYEWSFSKCTRQHRLRFVKTFHDLVLVWFWRVLVKDVQGQGHFAILSANCVVRRSKYWFSCSCDHWARHFNRQHFIIGLVDDAISTGKETFAIQTRTWGIRISRKDRHVLVSLESKSTFEGKIYFILLSFNQPVLSYCMVEPQFNLWVKSHGLSTNEGKIMVWLFYSRMIRIRT